MTNTDHAEDDAVTNTETARQEVGTGADRTGTPPTAMIPAQRTGPSIDTDSAAYWETICAAMPPMTAEQIAAVATVLRRIDARRAGQQ